jgi:hypothetical protein
MPNVLGAYLRSWFHPIPKHNQVAAIIGRFGYRKLLVQGRARLTRSQQKVPFDFTDDDIVLVYLYTHQTLRHYHYKSLNKVLRGLDHPKRDELLRLAGLVSTSLRKLPPHVGFTSRVTYLDRASLDEHRLGTTVTYLGFTSSSKLAWTPKRGQIQLTIYGKTGRYIGGMSRFPHEEEVLYCPGTKFRIVQADTTFGIMKFVMEEV